MTEEQSAETIQLALLFVLHTLPVWIVIGYSFALNPLTWGDLMVSAAASVLWWFAVETTIERYRGRTNV